MLAADKKSTSWGTACVGAIGAAAADTCDPDNDADCDGRKNENCECINGSAPKACPCGTQACSGGKLAACQVSCPGMCNGTMCCAADTKVCGSACVSKSDVKRCGPGCNYDCTQDNANAACGVANLCANTCKVSGTQLSCPGSEGKPNCGSWDFETGQQGWTAYGSDPSSVFVNVTTPVAPGGSRALAIHVITSRGGRVRASVQFCSNGEGIDAYKKILIARIRSANDPTYDEPNNISYATHRLTEFSVNSAWYEYSGAWTAVVAPATEEHFDFTFGDDWSGTIYIDDIQLK